MQFKTVWIRMQSFIESLQIFKLIIKLGRVKELNIKLKLTAFSSFSIKRRVSYLRIPKIDPLQDILYRVFIFVDSAWQFSKVVAFWILTSHLRAFQKTITTVDCRFSGPVLLDPIKSCQDDVSFQGLWLLQKYSQRFDWIVNSWIDIIRLRVSIYVCVVCSRAVGFYHKADHYECGDRP